MTTPMVTIDRLSLHTGAMSEADARRLAELVGLALGRLPAHVAASAAVSVTVPEQQGRSVEQLADVVARAIEAALRVEGGS
jgi:hypothetical protein